MRYLKVDGKPLSNGYGAWVVGKYTFLRATPPRESIRQQSARRHGSVSRLGKYQPGTGTIQMWITDIDPDYGIHGGYSQLRANEDAVKDILSPTGRAALVQEIFDDANPSVGRQAYCEVNASMEPESASQTYNKMTFIVEIPGAFWRDLNEHTLPLSDDLSPLRKGSAPIPDALFTVPGAGTNTVARITDNTTGRWIEWRGDAPAGQTIRLDPITEVGYIVASGDPWSGGVQKAGWVTVGPGGFEVSKEIDLTGPTGAMIRARRSFL